MICLMFLMLFLLLISDQLPSKVSSHSGHLNKNDISAPYPQSRNLVEMSNQQTSNIRPLPPVPHLNQ